MLMPVAAPSKA